MTRSALLLPLAIAAGVIAACSALTGVDKYDLNDCPKGDCSDASTGGSDGGADGSLGDGPAGADVAIDTGPACLASEGLVTLTVGGSASDTVFSDVGSLSVRSGLTGHACLPVGPVILRSRDGSKGSWVSSPFTCKQTQDDRCEFTNTPAGGTVTATLQN